MHRAAMLLLIGCHTRQEIVVDGAFATLHASLQGPCSQPIGADGGIAFPQTSTKQRAIREIQLHNDSEFKIPGYQDLGYTIEGLDAGDFALRPGGSPSQSDCNGIIFGSPDLAVGGSCDLGVYFQPTTPGDKEAMLHVSGSGVDVMFPIHGHAVAPPDAVATNTPDLMFGDDAQKTSFTILNDAAMTVAIGNAVASPPFVFDSWDCPSTLTAGGACTASLHYDRTLATTACPQGSFTTSTAAFVEPLFAPAAVSNLSVSTTSSLGTVLIDPGAQTCPPAGFSGNECSFSFGFDDQVVVTAVPRSGVQFQTWQQLDGPDAGCGDALSCMLPHGFASLSLTAKFIDPASKAIAVTIVGTGSVSVLSIGVNMQCNMSCTVYVQPGDSTSVTELTTGSFGGWSGDCSGTDSMCNLGTVVNNRSVTATFTP